MDKFRLKITEPGCGVIYDNVSGGRMTWTPQTRRPSEAAASSSIGTEITAHWIRSAGWKIASRNSSGSVSTGGTISGSPYFLRKIRDSCNSSFRVARSALPGADRHQGMSAAMGASAAVRSAPRSEGEWLRAIIGG